MKIGISPGVRRMLSLVGAMALGAGIPFAFRGNAVHGAIETAAQAIPFLVMTMLLFAFAGAKFSRESFSRSHLFQLVAMTTLACGGYAILHFAGVREELAISAFLIGMTPTATAAPVVSAMLGRRADYVAISLIVSNLFAALTISPLAALLIHSSSAHAFSAGTMAARTFALIGIPFFAALAIRRFVPAGAEFFRKRKSITLYLWMTVLFINCAKSSLFIAEHGELSRTLLLELFALAAVMCALNFAGGFWLGERGLRRECSQSLGQKNTMLTLWIGLTFFNPIVALGPTFYVICHNLWNSWQLRKIRPEK